MLTTKSAQFVKTNLVIFNLLQVVQRKIGQKRTLELDYSFGMPEQIKENCWEKHNTNKNKNSIPSTF